LFITRLWCSPILLCKCDRATLQRQYCCQGRSGGQCYGKCRKTCAEFWFQTNTLCTHTPAGLNLTTNKVQLRWRTIHLYVHTYVDHSAWVNSWVARCYICKPKTPIWVHFGGYYRGRCWSILCPLGPFYGHLVYFVDFVVIGYIFTRFGMLYLEKSGNPGELMQKIGFHRTYTQREFKQSPKFF
jgi:hypothetical protein